MAQLVEQRIRNAKVGSSTLFTGTKIHPARSCAARDFFFRIRMPGRATPKELRAASAARFQGKDPRRRAGGPVAIVYVEDRNSRSARGKH